jgi:hypothetical protein
VQKPAGVRIKVRGICPRYGGGLGEEVDQTIHNQDYTTIGIRCPEESVPFCTIRHSELVEESPRSYTPNMAKKATAPTAKPSSLVDTCVIYCGVKKLA